MKTSGQANTQSNKHIEKNNMYSSMTVTILHIIESER